MTRDTTSDRDMLRPLRAILGRTDGASGPVEEAFRALAEVVFEGVAVVEGGRISEANKAFASIFGYEQSAVVGRALPDLVAPEARSLLEKSLSSGLGEPDLPDGNGTELIGELRAANPDAAVLVLTASAEREAYARAVEAGAAGVLHKSVRIKEVVGSARRLMAGEPLLSTDEVVELLRLAGRRREENHEAQRAVESLTPRELEVLGLLAEGLSDKQISERLSVGIGTVRNHAVNIFNKLGVHSRLQALLFAVRHGIVDVT